MKLIVGLGNPGILYKDSRHNIGFTVIKALAKFFKIPLKKEKGIRSLSAKGRIGREEVILALPLTFMNLCGSALAGLIEKYSINLSGLLVVCDDLDLGLGRLKIRASGSSGGHNGLKSIIDALASEKFCRLRIGIGRPSSTGDAARYVLSRFKRKEKEELRKIIERASDCCQVWLREGISKSMDYFNRRRL